VHVQLVNISFFHLYSFMSFWLYFSHCGLCTWWRINTFTTTEPCLPAAFCAFPKRLSTRIPFDTHTHTHTHTHTQGERLRTLIISKVKSIKHVVLIVIVRFYSYKRHTATHTCIYSGNTGHTQA